MARSRSPALAGRSRPAWARGDAHAAYTALPRRLYHRWMGVTENRRPPRLHIIEIAISIRVIQIWAMSMIDKGRLASHGAKGPHGAIDASRQEFLRLRIKGTRSRQLQASIYITWIIHNMVLQVPNLWWYHYAPIASNISGSGCATHVNM